MPQGPGRADGEKNRRVKRCACARAEQGEFLAKRAAGAVAGVGAAAAVFEATALETFGQAQASEMAGRPASEATEVVGHVAGLEPNPSSNARAILRDALPVENQGIREVQKALEEINEDLRIPGVNVSGVQRATKKASKALTKNKSSIISSIKDENGVSEVDKLEQGLSDLKEIADNQDKQQIPVKQQELLDYVGNIEEAMVNGFPFDVPQEYLNLPQLKGRATVELSLRLKDNPNIANGSMRVILDGYNAPITAGNFVDLVQRRFYDGLPIQRADGFIVQTGDPEGPADGFVDPSTNETRQIPFEVRARGDSSPTYGETLEEQGRPRAQPVLPFNSFGTLAMARNEFETNSASSQIFFLLKEAELTPTGANILDGRYSVFGYVVDGQVRLFALARSSSLSLSLNNFCTRGWHGSVLR